MTYLGNSGACSASEIQIGRFTIGPNRPVFIVAEIGVNHNGDPELARRLVLAAKSAGADAVKFQSFRTEELVTASGPKADYQLRTTGTAGSQREMLRALELTAFEQERLSDFCATNEILFLSTPFDLPSVELLVRLGVPAFKISSSDTDNLPFLVKIAEHRRPMILSTGMSDLAEVRESFEAVLPLNRDIVVLQCTSLYPCPPEESRLRTIETLRNHLGCLVGYSDHTLGIGAAEIAAGLGACVIEKHFTLDKRLPGPDHAASASPDEFRRMVSAVRAMEASSVDERLRRISTVSEYDRYLGAGEKVISPALHQSGIITAARKSIVASIDIPRGTLLSLELLKMKRAGRGIPPRYVSQIIGSRVRRDVHRDEALRWDDFERPD